MRGRGAAKVQRGVTRVLDPGRHLHEREAALALAPTVENKTALADAWMEAGEPAKAVDLYSECLAGIYRTDRLLMGRLAGALHAAGYNARARQVYEDLLRIHGPLSDDRELFSFASTLEACGETDRRGTGLQGSRTEVGEHGSALPARGVSQEGGEDRGSREGSGEHAPGLRADAAFRKA